MKLPNFLRSLFGAPPPPTPLDLAPPTSPAPTPEEPVEGIYGHVEVFTSGFNKNVFGSSVSPTSAGALAKLKARQTTLTVKEAPRS